MSQVAKVEFECLKWSEFLILVMTRERVIFMVVSICFPIVQEVLKLARQLADGTVDKSELYKYRNEFCKDMGCRRRPRRLHGPRLLRRPTTNARLSGRER